MFYFIFLFVSFGYINLRIYGSNAWKAVDFMQVLEKTPGKHLAEQTQEVVPET